MSIKKAKGKIVRRLGVNIFESPKYEKILKKKPYPPGQQSKRRRKLSEYGKQLIEKQKIRFTYGVSEKQFENIFKKAKQMEGVTGTNMLILLERRLDNVLFRLGFAATRAQARQTIAHGHIMVNGKKVDIPSFLVKANDVISVSKKEKSQKLVERQIKLSNRASNPDWLYVSTEEMRGAIDRMPVREDIEVFGDEQAVVEYYAK